MADVKRKDEAPDPQEDSGKETRTKGVSRRGFLIGAGMGVSGLLVAGGTHFMNNLPDVAVERLLQNALLR